MFQIATQQDKPPLATLLSSKDGRSASKAEINSMARQHGSEKVDRHLSTQVRCNAGYGVDLHQTVSGQAMRINPKLLDEGTYPTSQDFLQLPRTYLLVQCRCEISLLLIPITRLPPATTRYTRTIKYVQGCSTSQTIIFMTTEISDHATKCSMNQNSTPGGYL